MNSKCNQLLFVVNNMKTLKTSSYQVFFDWHGFILFLVFKPIPWVLLMFHSIISTIFKLNFLFELDFLYKVIPFLQKFSLKCPITRSIYNKHTWSSLYFELKLYCDFIPGIWFRCMWNLGLTAIVLSVGMYDSIDF